MKQYLAVLALALALSGCNGGNTTGTEAYSAQTEEEKTSSATEAKQEAGAAKAEVQEAAGRPSEKEGEEDAAIKMQGEMPLEIGSQAPDFTTLLVDGTSVTLSNLQGKPVIINFWATWCGPCVREMPAFERLQKDFGDKIEILAVNCGEDAATVKEFVKKNGYTFPVALDEAYATSILYPTNGIPYTVIVDKEGIVTEISTGASDADTMYEMYKEALGL